jgi:hypothetical protein
MNGQPEIDYMTTLTRAEIMAKARRDALSGRRPQGWGRRRRTQPTRDSTPVIHTPSTGESPEDRQGCPSSGPQADSAQVDDVAIVLAHQLETLWDELARQGAVINRVPLKAHPDLLRARIEHEARRIRALGERP